MVKFEYLTELGNYIEDEDILNELGEEGWEFIGYFKDEDVTLFKRIKCEGITPNDQNTDTILPLDSKDAEIISLEKEYNAAFAQFRNAQKNDDTNAIRHLITKLDELNQKLSRLEAEQTLSKNK